MSTSSPQFAARFIGGACFVLILLGTSVSLHAQALSDVSVTVGGLVQAETSYGSITRTDDERSRVGFGLRRTRLRVGARVGPKAGAFLHLDADAGTAFSVLDAYAYYDPTPKVRLRLGRMASAQPRAFIPTPVVAMDANDRAAIALLWGQNTLGNKGRDFGIDLRYLGSQGEVTVFLHNGFGGFDRQRGNYQEGITGDVTGGVDRGLGEMAVSVAGAFRPAGVAGLELGGFAGFNGSENPATAVNETGRDYVSYSAHAYWGAEPGSQPIRLKADLIGVQYDTPGNIPQQHTLGVSAFGAVAVQRATEVFGRFELYNPNIDGDGSGVYFLAAGLNFSPSQLRGRPFSQERLTLAYNARIPEHDDAPLQHFLVLQAQINF